MIGTSFKREVNIIQAGDARQKMIQLQVLTKQNVWLIFRFWLEQT